jgi:hypothetical protein
MKHSIEASEQERRELVFPTLENGFTHTQRGRSGYLYYKDAGRMLELYTELSGVPEYHFLIWEEGLEAWVYPNRESLSTEEKTRISQELGYWLRKQGHKTNFKG